MCCGVVCLWVPIEGRRRVDFLELALQAVVAT